jgi:hypothetical protein
MTAPVLADYSFQYGDSGILLNGDPLSDGSILDITQIDGLDSAPLKTSTASYEGRDGGIINAFNEDMRQPVITGTLYGGSDPIFQTIDMLKDNFAPRDDGEPQPLYFQQEGTDLRQLFCKPLGFNYSWTAAMRTGTTPFTIKFQAEDPTIYGTDFQSIQGTCLTPNSVPGYAWSRAWSYSWGGAASVGTSQLFNNGNKYTGFYADIMGQACTNPVIACDTQPGMFVSTNITIGAQDTLRFDFYNQALLLNGQSRGNSVLNEGWFFLKKGINQLRFSADSLTPANIQYQYFYGYR